MSEPSHLSFKTVHASFENGKKKPVVLLQVEDRDYYWVCYTRDTSIETGKEKLTF